MRIRGLRLSLRSDEYRPLCLGPDGSIVSRGRESVEWRVVAGNTSSAPAVENRVLKLKAQTLVFGLFLSATACGVLPPLSRADAPGEWWGWRGPHRNGVAEEDQSPPVRWSETQNVLWKTPLPGRGHSSPTLVAGKVILTTADEGRQVQSVVCFDRKTGKELWNTVINRGSFPARIHRKNTHATPSVASDGRRLFAVFHNNDGIQLAALNLDGRILWQKRTGAFVPERYKFGYAPSPLVYQSRVIVCAESEADGFLAAYDPENGRQLWRTPRPKQLNFSSPVVGHVAGRDQLLLSGGGLIAAYHPLTGKKLWSCPGICTVTCGTMVWDDRRVFASGGYPQRGTMAVAADGSGRVVWTNRVKCYEQSLLVHDGYVYAVDDRGVAYCWKSDDGTEMWKKRLGGNYSASPVLADGNLYVSNESGTTFVFRANPKQFELVAQNRLGDEAFATPSICGGRIFLRVARRTANGRQEWLYCIGKK